MNSPLATYTNLTANCNHPRQNTISKITIHHMAGVMSGRSCADYFKNPGRQVSANYCIGNDGDIAVSVNEEDRAWTSSSGWNDHQAVTIEVSDCKSGGEWPISDKAFESLIKLCVDICKRNPGIKRKDGKNGLYYDGTKNGSVTTHRMFAATSCPEKYILDRLPLICSLVNDILDGKEVEIVANPIATTTESTTTTSTASTTSTTTLYRVRKTWTDSSSQIGAYKSLDSAIALAKEKTGYCVFDSNGNQVYPEVSTPTTTTTEEKIEKGDIVKVKPGSKSYEGLSIASFVYNNTYEVGSMSGNRYVLAQIQTAFKVEDLILIKKKVKK